MQKIPNDPKYLEVHSYPDGLVETAMTQLLSPRGFTGRNWDDCPRSGKYEIDVQKMMKKNGRLPAMLIGLLCCLALRALRIGGKLR